ncbi:MAG: GNAT family N-acetyltransferase [Candidatus Coatesbacteria bacterium]|nr:MAG: GNAT family N-acetyltransferase [Candidatus Coatesbacteria bacterium]
MGDARIVIAEAEEEDLSFLLGMWNDTTVMRYCGYPEGKGWTDVEIAKWWRYYLNNRAEYGAEETQFILRVPDGTRVGESYVGRVPEDFAVGDWRKPPEVRCLMADVKLATQWWGQGLGTVSMRLVTAFVFEQTSCELFVVPPHRDNPAAVRVYEKACFRHTGVWAWPGHEIMEMSRDEYASRFPEQGEGAV